MTWSGLSLVDAVSCARVSVSPSKYLRLLNLKKRLNGQKATSDA
jgi:hypothetical protein